MFYKGPSQNYGKCFADNWTIYIVQIKCSIGRFRQTSARYRQIVFLEWANDRPIFLPIVK